MELIYKRSESTVKPVEIEKSKHTIFIRKDIGTEDRTDTDGNTITYWTYQEAKLPIADWDEYVKSTSVLNGMTSKNNSQNIASLIDGQKNGDDNQLVIMEAIADLYEMVSELIIGGVSE